MTTETTAPAVRPLMPEQRAAIAELIGDAKPATDQLLLEMAQQIRDRREHDHSTGADWDWYCLNASGWLGDKAPTVLRRLLDAEDRIERRRARLVALQNDALNMRGSLAPNGGPRAVPFELGETLTPAVDWLIAEVERLQTERHSMNESLSDAAEALREMRDRTSESYPGELAMLRGLVATLRAVTEHGDLADVVLLLDEHQRDEQDAYALTGQAAAEDDDPARCLEVHPFSPRDGWRMVCGNCDHGKDASCHKDGAR